jgi:hypothetical protein
MEKVTEIIKQVIHNPQVSRPPISYVITDKSSYYKGDYTAEYIDKGDFDSYLEELEKQLIFRLKDICPTITQDNK